jgi:hypothetical protein
MRPFVAELPAQEKCRWNCMNDYAPPPDAMRQRIGRGKEPFKRFFTFDG